ncbi:MAG: alginate export family protein [Deltaproteobacteria bacterium]|nr:alginate export family protein [Deltaproteobacteria bacterium]
MSMCFSARLAPTLALACAGLLLGPVQSARAMRVVDGVDLGLQLRTRLNRNDGRDGSNAGDAALYFDNVARLSLRLTHASGLAAFAQVQDVRVWGEEADTLTDYSADGFDLHQAYGDLPLMKDQLVLRVGRQEIRILEERLVGAVAWTPQARSFDAVRLRWTPRSLRVEGDLFFAQVRDTESVAPGPETNPNDDNVLFLGAVSTVRLVEGAETSNALSVQAFYDRSRADERDRVTVGLYDRGAAGVFRYRLEGYFQGGSLAGGSIAAWMLGLEAGVLLERARNLQFVLWGDYLSGTGSPADAARKSFDTLFATNHAFYGYADFFINVPARTGGRGLVDIALKASLDPCPKLKLALHLHQFLAANDQGGDADLGREVDLTASFRPWEPAELFFGLFTMLPGDGLGGGDPDVGVYTWVKVEF